MFLSIAYLTRSHELTILSSEFKKRVYKSFFRPLLQKIDHEKAKNTTIDIIHSLENPLGLKLFETIAADKGRRFSHPRLKTTVAGIQFDNPLILAAGWDREGRAVKGMHRLGFGGIEIGTVTAYPQPGNPKPRLHLLDQDVALNYFGFSGPGMEVVAQNLKRYRNSGIPIGINVVKNKYATPAGAAPFYAVVVRRLYEFGSYFVINVSSPNTAGLKVLQDKKYLEQIVKEVLAMMEDVGERKPLFIKIAPDIPLKTLDGVIELTVQNNLAGIIAVNTFPHGNSLAKYGQTWEDRQGGLSGNDTNYRNIGTKYLAYIHNQTQGKVTTIGVGGIHDTQTALEKIAAGASMIQVLTGLFSEGPTLPGKINRGLVDFMEREHVKSLSEIKGIDAKRIWENKGMYSFAINHNENSLDSLKKEYLSAVFRKNTLDTLLVREKPFQLKHGELGRTWSRIYLNHRIPLFNNIEYRRLFARILDTLIKEKLLMTTDYGLISVPSSGSLDMTNSLMEITNEKIERLVIIPEGIRQEEHGAHAPFYGTVDENKTWILVDDVFTSGKTMKQAIFALSSNKKIVQNMAAISLVARNENMITSFQKQTQTPIVPFATLDEILQYHWNDFSTSQKKLIKKERIALN